jgi:PEP-CTERM motif
MPIFLSPSPVRCAFNTKVGRAATHARSMQKLFFAVQKRLDGVNRRAALASAVAWPERSAESITSRRRLYADFLFSCWERRSVRGLTAYFCAATPYLCAVNQGIFKMRKTLLMTTGLTWLALTGAASAAVVVTLTPESALGPSELSPTYFVGQSVGANTFSVGTDQWSLVNGSAGIETVTKPTVFADPLGDTTPFMSVQAGSEEQVVFGSARTSISIYWGSIDGNQGGNNNLNTFAITVDGFTLTGKDLVALGATGTGDETSPTGNQLVTITGLDAFTTATFSSTRNAFEFSLETPTGITGGTPEPTTWAMMMVGFAGLGYAAFRRNTKGRALAI